MTDKLSPLTRPIRTSRGRADLFATFDALSDEAREKLLERANAARKQDPQELRRMAVEVAFSTTQRRRLIREIESAIASNRGNGFIAAFPHLTNTVLFEVTKDTPAEDIADLEIEDVRADAEEFFRQHRETLYIDRIRIALAATGIDLDDATIKAVFEDMDRRGVPLPVPGLEGVLP